MYCSNCGESIVGAGKFCSSCGYDVSNQLDASEINEILPDNNEESHQILDVNQEKVFTSLSEAEKPEVKESKSLEGIGGWLIVIIIGQIITIFRCIATLDESFKMITDKDFAYVFDSTSAYYSRAAESLIYSELIGTIIVLMLSFGVLITMFTKTKIFRPYMISYMTINLLLILIYAGISKDIPNSFFADGNNTFVSTYIGTFIGGLISYSLWVAYLFKSVRVRNTFGYNLVE